MLLTVEDVLKTDDLELVWGTTRCLPKFKDLPVEFQTESALGCELAKALFYGKPMPKLICEWRPGFESLKFEQLNKFVRAHLTSREPKHEHKMAGVGWLIEQAMELRPA